MSDTRTYEDHGRKARRFTNDTYLFWRSYDNRRDIPAFRVNKLDKLEFKEVPHVEGLGPLALATTPEGSGQYFFSEPKIITNDNIATKSFDLTHTPTNPNAVMMFPVGGCQQFVNKDFTITNKTVSWLVNSDLGRLLEANDEVIMFYQM